MAVQLHVKDTFNYEEAAHAAADIVGSKSPSTQVRGFEHELISVQI